LHILLESAAGVKGVRAHRDSAHRHERLTRERPEDVALRRGQTALADDATFDIDVPRAGKDERRCQVCETGDVAASLPASR
jgi:hypothetical protein